MPYIKTYRMEVSVKNKSDDLIFHTAICAEASQISLDATREIALRLSLARFLRYASEWRLIWKISLLEQLLF